MFEILLNGADERVVIIGYIC